MTTTTPLSSHEVFISYSHKNKKWADAACAVLERQRIRCWVAPRDIIPGTEWGAAIIEGIDACKILVLIFSADANESPQVRREVERAISKGLIVLPFRIEDVKPAGAMEYALSNTHWLDAFTPPVEKQLERLAVSVKSLLDPTIKTASLHRGDNRSTSTKPDKFSFRALLLAFGLAIALIASLVLLKLTTRSGAATSSADVPNASKANQETVQANNGDIQVGSRVSAKMSTAGYDVISGNDISPGRVSQGATGTVLKVNTDYKRCLVKLDNDTREALWILIDKLEVIK